MQTFTNRSHCPITSVSENTTADTEIVGAMKAKQDAILKMLCTLTTRVDQPDQLERKVTFEEQPQG